MVPSVVQATRGRWVSLPRGWSSSSEWIWSVYVAAFLPGLPRLDQPARRAGAGVLPALPDAAADRRPAGGARVGRPVRGADGRCAEALAPTVGRAGAPPA